MIDNEQGQEEQPTGETAAAAGAPQAAADPAAVVMNIAAEGTSSDEESASAEQEADEVRPADAASEQPPAGENLLDKVTGMLPEASIQKASSLLDRDGDGNPINDIAGLAGKFLGRS